MPGAGETPPGAAVDAPVGAAAPPVPAPAAAPTPRTERYPWLCPWTLGKERDVGGAKGNASDGGSGGAAPVATPTDAPVNNLRVLNSLTGEKEPFRPRHGRIVQWYTCGPTVYDETHVGHASNYVSLDILRRILSDYFGYDITFQMNVTDIDDKIIQRAAEAGEPFAHLARRWEAAFFEDMRSLGVRPPDLVTRVSEYVPDVIAYIAAIVKRGMAYAAGGSVYFDVAAFRAGGHHYAKLEPGSAGNAERLAEGEGGLDGLPAASTDAPEGSSVEAAEADVAAAARGAEKKSPSDWALWKASRPGEPYWDSPWGPGRPGWHIECSAMASAELGGQLDIHSGGVDLKFPHHDNELAQAEAYHGCPQWVDYFLHTGHLHIDGRKMSKSLKNFISIRSVLTRVSSRQLRLFFLQHRYDAQRVYAESALAEVVNVDRGLVDFFGAVKAALREAAATATAPTMDDKEGSLRPTAEASSLLSELAATRTAVRVALEDNFNTPTAFLALLGLIKAVKAYLGAPGSGGVNAHIVRSVARYITFMLRVFGLGGDAGEELGYGAADGSVETSAEAVLTPVLDALSTFRDTIRGTGREVLAAGGVGGDGSGDNGSVATAAIKRILVACDEVRDTVLPPLGIRLEDRPDGRASLWKLVDPAEAAAEAARLAAETEAKEAAKAERAAAAAAKAAAELEAGRVPPGDLFRVGADYAGKYSAWDADGLPTADAAGVELPKAARKRLAKVRERQVKLHQKWLAAQGAAVDAA
ncbi:hypothetical protein MMPV_006029 [Pyropia vietnamensis]